MHPTEGKYLNLFALYGSLAAVNVLADLMIYIYPIYLLWNLQISKSEKAGLIGIFVTGAV